MTGGDTGGTRGGLARLRLTPRGVAVLVCGLLLLIAGAQPGLAALAYPGCLALAALLVAAVASLARTRARALSRSVAPDLATAGEPVAVSVRVGQAAGRARWADELSADLVGDASGVLAQDEDGGLVARYRVIAARRGRHEAGPFAIEVADPFGLVRARRRLSGTTAFLALPAIVALPSPPTSAEGGVASSSDARRGPVRGLEDQIPREWRSGDGIRRVHWRATAHRGELMVRQEEPAEDVGLAVVLDAVGSGYVDAEELDRTVELAASVLGAAADLDARTAVAVLGDREPTMLIGGAGASATLEDALVRLAILTPGRAGPLPAVPSAPVVVAVLGRLDAERAAAVAPLRRPGARGIAIALGRDDAPALDVLAAAGWTVAAWDGLGSAADAWSAATGAHR